VRADSRRVVGLRDSERVILRECDVHDAEGIDFSDLSSSTLDPLATGFCALKLGGNVRVLYDGDVNTVVAWTTLAIPGGYRAQVSPP
jgi:hypothetical protein